MAEQLSLALFTKDQELMYCFPLDEDVFSRFFADTYFEGVRLGQLTQRDSWVPDVRAKAADGEEHCSMTSEFVVEIEAGGQRFAKTYTSEVFRPLVNRLSPELVQRDWLSPGAVFTYLLLTNPGPALEPRSLIIPSLVERPSGYFNGHAKAELPVRIAPQVLEEILAIARSSTCQEVGGALIGNLCLCDGEIGVDIDAHLPARFAEATHTSLKFTGQTYSDWFDLIAARGGGELISWWHSHPFDHKKQLHKKKPQSVNLFLSEQDLFVLETNFPNPWNTALVVDPLAQQHQSPFALFGWKDGQIQQLQFHIAGGKRR